jgi:hypothetical protein
MLRHGEGTMTTVDPQSAIPGALAALDWQEITCQSEGGCTNRATHVVYRHAVDECNRPNLDPSGNIVDILCISCVRSLKAQLLQQVDQIARCPGGHCLTCGAPVHQLSDVMRKMVQLRSYA